MNALVDGTVHDDNTGDDDNAGGMPRHLMQACSRALPVTGAGLSLVSAGGALDGLVAASNDTARTVADLQFDLGEGPCLEASRSRRPVLVADLAHDVGNRWPIFVAGVFVHGVAALFSFPLHVGTLRVGVLDLYCARAGALEEAAYAEALHYAGAATALLLHLQAHLPVAEDGIALADDRAVVHQASGVVSVSAGVAVADALLMLRGRAYAEGRAVSALATDVVAGRAHLK